MDFLTEVGAEGKGCTTLDSREKYLKYMHDLLIIAAKDHYDVWIQTVAITPDCLADDFEKITGSTFIELLKPILANGHSVGILIWGSQELKPVMINLATEINNPKLFRAYLSGTNKGARQLDPYIVIADGMKSSWGVLLKTNEKRSKGKFEGVFMLRDSTAEETGESFLKGFYKISDGFEEQVRNMRKASNGN